MKINYRTDMNNTIEFNILDFKVEYELDYMLF